MTTIDHPAKDATSKDASAPPSSSGLSLWILPPKQRDAARITTTPAIAVPPRPRLRVLIADDDPTLVEVTSLILHLSGYEVVVAEDGEQAWRAYLERGCDLLLTDQDMPNLSGLELIERIRAQGDPVPVVLASGRIASGDIPPPLRDLIDVVLPKPFTSDLLLETLRACLRRTTP